MATWTKLSRDFSIKGRAPRAKFGVCRARSGTRMAYFIIPRAEHVSSDRADVYSDGNGKLAFRLHDGGEFSVSNKTGPRRVAIPTKMAGRIPYGTIDVEITRDGDMYVLDLNQIGAGS